MVKRYPLDLQFFASEKTEKATPQKRQESKRKGQVAKSAEIPSALIMLGGILMLYFSGGFLLDQLQSIYRVNFTQYISWELTPKNIRTIFEQMAFNAAKIMAPIMLVGLIFGVLGNYVQIGFLFTTEPLKAEARTNRSNQRREKNIFGSSISRTGKILTENRHHFHSCLYCFVEWKR